MQLQPLQQVRLNFFCIQLTIKHANTKCDSFDPSRKRQKNRSSHRKHKEILTKRSHCHKWLLKSAQSTDCHQSKHIRWHFAGAVERIERSDAHQLEQKRLGQQRRRVHHKDNGHIQRHADHQQHQQQHHQQQQQHDHGDRVEWRRQERRPPVGDRHKRATPQFQRTTQKVGGAADQGHQIDQRQRHHTGLGRQGQQAHSAEPADPVAGGGQPDSAVDHADPDAARDWAGQRRRHHRIGQR